MTYGCYNRPPFAEATLQDVPYTSGGYMYSRLHSIANRGSRDCQYTKTVLGQADAGCVGCKGRDDAKGLREFDPVI